MIPHWLQTVVDRLLWDRERISVLTLGSARAVRVGRNHVWRVQHNHSETPCFFAKFWSKPLCYERELFGLEVINRLAAIYPWLMPIELVKAERDHGLILIEGLTGDFLEDLLKRALRIDRNPFRRHAARKLVASCLRLLFDFVHLLQQQPAVKDQVLLDHSPHGIWTRIEEKTAQLRPFKFSFMPLLEQVLACRARTADWPAETKLIHGDLTPGNLVFDGSRLGIIDFEDMGAGPSFVDFLVISSALEQIRGKWHYYSAEDILSSIPSRGVPYGILALYKLERALNSMAATCCPSMRTGFWSSMMSAIGSYHQNRGLKKLCRSILQESGFSAPDAELLTTCPK